MAIKKKPRACGMTGKQYDDAITKLGLTQVAAARFFKIGARTSRRYVAGGKIPYSTVMLLHLMIERNISPEDLGFQSTATAGRPYAYIGASVSARQRKTLRNPRCPLWKQQ